MAGLTPKSTKLSGAGGYTTTTATKSGGSGVLKPFGGGVADRRLAGTVTKNRIFPGRSGSDPFTSAVLQNTARQIV